ncbi:MAG: esterase [Glaciihabitans sp.]|jgi:acetyl esterase/lipase|nr:esterase [Glaciihabitans sp.]
MRLSFQIRRVPVWVWRLLMAHLASGERRRFNQEPIDDVHSILDIDYSGDAARQHRLDVIAPREHPGPLPVYVYFHGGGWTSGDKSAVTKYCAIQASGGAVVVNANYRMATRFHMRHMLEDAASVLCWVESEIAGFGGDPDRVVVGGDSAGGQIAALIAAAQLSPELVAHYGLGTSFGRRLVGVVQHCSAVDFSVMLERGFILSRSFVRMLLPPRDRSLVLTKAARYLSPIEWVSPGFPPVFVTTSEQDPFYGANLNFIRRLRSLAVPVDVLTYDKSSRNTRHTWQQDYHFPESQEVYRRLATFVSRVAPSPRPVR